MIEASVRVVMGDDRDKYGDDIKCYSTALLSCMTMGLRVRVIVIRKEEQGSPLPDTMNDYEFLDLFAFFIGRMAKLMNMFSL